MGLDDEVDKAEAEEEEKEDEKHSEDKKELNKVKEKEQEINKEKEIQDEYEKENEGIKPTKNGVGTISEAAKILADRLVFIGNVTGNPKNAEEAGYNAGSDIAVIKGSIERVLHGKATIDEALALASNVSGLLKGFFHTANAFAEAERAIQELRKEAIKKMRKMKR